MKYADLHIHTNFSDSTSTPEEVVAQSIQAGLSAISITDHDTVEGIEPAVKEAGKFNLEIIPGIEMTSEVDGTEIHILGYFVDCQDNPFLKKIEELKEIRVKRIYAMVDKLRELGVDNLDAGEVIELAGPGAVGRVHLAIMLQRKGWVYSIAEAFHRYIGDKCPAYVSKFRFTPAEVINIIQKAGGVTVLAHPHTYSEKDELISSLVDVGLQGLEVYYPGYSKDVTETYKNIALKYSLLITGGSDDHGLAKEQTSIGKVKIPYELVEKLKQAKC